jgi:hypothetical protein
MALSASLSLDIFKSAIHKSILSLKKSDSRKSSYSQKRGKSIELLELTSLRES